MKNIPISKQINSLSYSTSFGGFYASYFLMDQHKDCHIVEPELSAISLEATGDDWETLKSYKNSKISMYDALCIVISYEQMLANKEEAKNIVGGWDKAIDSLNDKNI